MAIFIPADETKKDFNNSYGEYLIHKSLKSLPDDYIVFHSLEWRDREKEKNIKFGECDYVIFNPKRGILVIEAKGGSIYAKNQKFYQKNRSTGKVKIIDPLKQAEKSKYKFRRELEANNCRYDIQSAVWFTDVDGNNDIHNVPLNYDINVILTKKDLKNPKSSIDSIFDYYKMFEKTTYTKEDKTKVIAKLSPKFNAIASLKSSLEKDEYEFDRMTAEECRILDYLQGEKYASITGGAGTGKTTVGIEKATRLVLNGEKVLFLCYNKFLANTLQEKYVYDLPQVTFTNLDSLMFKLNEGYLGKDPDEKTLEILLNYKEYEFDYKNIIIDEGQDFPPDILEALYEISKENDGVFYLFYDENQIVNHRTNKETWKDPVNKSKLKLTVNCRNTKNIAYFSYECITGMDSDVKVNSRIIGEKIDFKLVKDKQEMEDEAVKIIDYYVSNKIPKSNIVIISLKSEDESTFDTVTKIGTHNLVKSLSKNESKILKTTARRYKGLESDIVIIVDLDNYSMQRDDIENLFYVSASRAKHRLHVLSELPIKDIPFLSDNLEKVKAVVK